MMRMHSFFKIFACCAGMAVLSGGCLSPRTSGVVVEKGRLTIEDAAFATNLVLLEDRMERTPEGFLHAQVTLKNANRRDYACQYRFVWKNADGLVLSHARTHWTPLVLHGSEEKALDVVSPIPNAADFRLVLRRLP